MFFSWTTAIKAK